ncbi:MAG TPA: hypothetical protein VM487_21640 [Phycisphaerae bacterium]|nr:hypothetical protein [Phycisphaerae bacterium]
MKCCDVCRAEMDASYRSTLSVGLTGRCGDYELDKTLEVCYDCARPEGWRALPGKILAVLASEAKAQGADA